MLRPNVIPVFVWALPLLIAQTSPAEAGVIYNVVVNGGSNPGGVTSNAPIADSFVVDFGAPSFAFVENTAFAGAFSVGASSRLRSSILGSSTSSFATASFVTDDIFIAADPGMPTTDIEFGFDGNLTGTLEADVGGAFDRAIVRLRVTILGREIINRQIFHIGSSTTINELLHGSTMVPVNEAIPMTILLSAETQNGFGRESASLFNNSFTWNSNSVFDLPDGYTANSESWGLVNNQLTSSTAVPEPSSLLLLSIAGIGLLVFGLRRIQSAVHDRAIGRSPGA